MKILLKVSWAVKRLRVMNGPEIRYRLRGLFDLVRMRMEYSIGHRFAKEFNRITSVATPGATRFMVPSPLVDSQRLVAERASIMSGGVDYAGVRWDFTESANVWRWTGARSTLWPVVFFARIDFRPGNAHGDARVAWEPARLQHLYAMSELLADADTNTAQSIQEAIESQTHSWIKANPLYCGIHYVSAMECGLRIIAVAHTAANLEQHQRLSSQHAQQVVTLIAQHAGFIKRKISRFSSAGNHTLAECAGLIYAALMLKQVTSLPEYYHSAVHTFVHELDRQVLNDGTGIECSTWYHKFNLELAELVSGLLHRHKEVIPDKLKQAIDRGGRFLHQLNSSQNDFVVIGDSDDGYALSGYHLGSWRQAMPAAAISEFSDGGVSIVRTDDWSVVFDHGPLGTAPGFGHGHADALSLIVHYQQQEIFCDTGTGRYSGNPSMRAYFRGTSAHNCVQIGELDYARQETAFMWSKPYQCKLAHRHIDNDKTEYWAHLVVQQPADSHLWRYVLVQNDLLVVVDEVKATAQHQRTLRWHIPQTLLQLDSRLWKIGLQRSALYLQIHGGSVVEGQPGNTYLGNRSRHYGTLEKISTVQMVQSEASENCFITVLGCAPDLLTDSQLDQFRQRAKEKF